LRTGFDARARFNRRGDARFNRRADARLNRRADARVRRATGFFAERFAISRLC